MPVKKQDYTIYSKSGDQHGEDASTLYMNPTGETTALKNTRGYSAGVQKSDLDAVFAKFKRLIAASDIQGFAAFLRLNFVIDGKCQSHYNHFVDASSGQWGPEYRAETYLVRPHVEALFFYKPALFLALIDLLIEKGDASLTAEFLKSLKNTDFNNPSLLQWDDTIKQNVLQQLTNFANYGQLLSQKKEPSAQSKGQKITALAIQLNTTVTNKPTTNGQAATDKTLLENLRFKVSVFTALHGEDQAFSQHRGWKRALLNIFAALCLGIPKLIYWAAKGHTFFFDKTETECKVLDTQQAMGFNSPEFPTAPPKP